MFDIIREDNKQRYEIKFVPIKPGETNIKVIDLLIDYYKCYVSWYEAETI
jgi:hypothetical protein